MPELIRSFVAVKVPDEISDKLENFISRLRPLSNIRWVKREQFHITLKFLGEIEPEIFESVKNSLLPLKNFEPFKIELSFIGAFPSIKNANVLWISGTKGTKELAAISKRVNDVLYECAEIERDTKKFKAHLTLARLKGERISERLLSGLGTLPQLNWLCSELVLMRSVLTPKGPIYTQIL